MFISAAFVRSWNLSALTLWSQGEGRRGECGTGRLPGQSFFHFSHFHCPSPSPLPAPAACHAASRQTVFILRRFALFDAADKSNSCSPTLPPPLPPPWDPFVPLVLQVFQLIFAVLQQSRGAKANSTCLSLVCGFFSSIFGQCCTYDLCSLLLLLLLLLLFLLLLPRRFFVPSDP